MLFRHEIYAACSAFYCITMTIIGLVLELSLYADENFISSKDMVSIDL